MVPPIRLLNPVYWVTFFAALILSYVSVLLPFDHRSDWINELRRLIFPKVNTIFKKVDFIFTVTYAGEDELAAKTPLSADEVEKLLQEIGFTRNIASALKRTPDGDYADGSWVFRESKHWWAPDYLAIWQLHAIVDQTGDETHIYVHYEYSSINPLTAYYHVRGPGRQVKKGIKKFRELWDGHAT